MTGFSLIEVLVSLLLLSLVLLGLEALEISAVQQSRESYYIFVARQQLHNLEERLRSSGTAGLSSAQFMRWQEENQSILPQGSGRLMGSYPKYHLQIVWGMTKHSSCLQENFSLG